MAAKRRTKRGARKPRRPARRRHVVHANLSNFPLAKPGSSLNLEIFGRNRHTRKRIDWSRFAQMLDELAYGKGR